MACFTIIKGTAIKLNVLITGDVSTEAIRVYLDQDEVVADKYSTDVTDQGNGYGTVFDVSYDSGTNKTTVICHLEKSATVDYPVGTLDVSVRTARAEIGFTEDYTRLGEKVGIITVREILTKADLT